MTGAEVRWSSCMKGGRGRERERERERESNQLNTIKHRNYHSLFFFFLFSNKSFTPREKKNKTRIWKPNIAIFLTIGPTSTGTLQTLKPAHDMMEYSQNNYGYTQLHSLARPVMITRRGGGEVRSKPPQHSDITHTSNKALATFAAYITEITVWDSRWQVNLRVHTN